MANKIIPVVISVVCAVGVYMFFGSAGSIEDRIAATAEELQAELPMQVDAVTSLEGIAADGAALVYTYSLALAAADVDVSVLEAQKPVIAAQACAQADMRAVLDEGATFRYFYNDQDGTEIGQVEISSSDC